MVKMLYYSMDHNSDYKYRIDQAFFTIIKMPPGQREDLRRMWRACRNRWDQLDIELINCRRTNKVTPKYTELATDLDQCLLTLESYISWGHLVG
jgi:hypothetical protein